MNTSSVDMCDAAVMFQTSPDDFLTPIQLNATSHYDSNAEPACRLGFEILHERAENTDVPAYTCGADMIDREMAIAFVNSDFHSHVKESDEWDDYSPCDEHFETRYAIGTHAADYHDLRDWSSRDAHAIYVSTVVLQLFEQPFGWLMK